jgi:hypothetical protein
VFTRVHPRHFITSWRTTPYSLSVTAYSIYTGSYLPHPEATHSIHNPKTHHTTVIYITWTCRGKYEVKVKVKVKLSLCLIKHCVVKVYWD